MSLRTTDDVCDCGLVASRGEVFCVTRVTQPSMRLGSVAIKHLPKGYMSLPTVSLCNDDPRMTSHSARLLSVFIRGRSSENNVITRKKILLHVGLQPSSARRLKKSHWQGAAKHTLTPILGGC
ncbi:hypothetical protein NDU88_005152 [Pleurodeles waltl]|uniref:Uncharacterized protein n=1 Tax=Pleurodeles waltl TaxID=8319 RepID=A0AAV7N0E4_PLEWA|nr:hypothetical protein NDU88_005152 [Pleurodeles waltl]